MLPFQAEAEIVQIELPCPGHVEIRRIGIV
jgi:hypothetical protein